MDQKWTKRQNERPPESREIDLRPFRIQMTKSSKGLVWFSQMSTQSVNDEICGRDP